MARNTEFYKGQRKRRNKVLLPTAIVLGLISLAVVLFYGMQKYAVITKDAVSVVLPILGEDGVLAPQEEAGPAELETADVSIVFDAPNYGLVEQTVTGNLPPIRAIFVPVDEINKDKLTEYGNRLVKGNALVLEMKPSSGLLTWDSKSPTAISYGLAGNPLPQEVREVLDALKAEKGVWLAAQISICRDDLFASRSTIVTLRNEAGGNYMDEGGAWLDAYSLEVRRYTVELARELYDMGFDEVILANVAHPKLADGVKLTYTRSMSTPPSAVNAVCGFAVDVAEELADRPGALSIYIDSAPALVRADSNTGQDGRMFLKLYDRVYYNTDRSVYSYNLTDISPGVTVGEATSRFVPVVINYLPDNSENVSWVLIDTESE